ncbi:MAG: hypothetical protein QXS93_02010 [Candidatus Micrarchaeia archaeon]
MAKLNLLYVYDIKPQNPSKKGSIKRNFYYHMEKLRPFIRRATESVILTSKEHESTIDGFFMRFLNDVEVYKCDITKLTILKKM